MVAPANKTIFECKIITPEDEGLIPFLPLKLYHIQNYANYHLKPLRLLNGGNIFRISTHMVSQKPVYLCRAKLNY